MRKPVRVTPFADGSYNFIWMFFLINLLFFRVHIVEILVCTPNAGMFGSTRNAIVFEITYVLWRLGSTPIVWRFGNTDDVEGVETLILLGCLEAFT